jgi:ribosomal protein S18 acetylase RimI-like enzyme
MLRLSLRSITDRDLEFLYEVYASTRADELAVVPWDDAQKEEFLQMQFGAQHSYYQQHYSDATFDVIEVDGRPVGRCYVQRRVDEFRIVDIALLPAHRGQGIGSELLNELIDEAEAARLPVTIHVEQHNPAIHLYTRLGFTLIDDTGVYYLMKRTPPEPSSGPS